MVSLLEVPLPVGLGGGRTLGASDPPVLPPRGSGESGGAGRGRWGGAGGGQSPGREPGIQWAHPIPDTCTVTPSHHYPPSIANCISNRDGFDEKDQHKKKYVTCILFHSSFMRLTEMGLMMLDIRIDITWSSTAFFVG